jgi:hypothetical protein
MMLRGNVRYATCTWHQLVKDEFLFDFFASQFLKTNKHHLEINIMKKLTIFISTLLLLTLNAFSQSAEIKGLLDKQDTRTEIFNAIFNDHQLMTEFMKGAKSNKHASMMMHNEAHQTGKMESGNTMGELKGNHPMMDSEKMMEMMKNNPEMMKKMMGNMMQMCEKDTAMRSQMTNMMTEHPEMMKMCMQKMQEKGMMGTDGKMKMMDDKKQSEDKEHHHQH